MLNSMETKMPKRTLAKLTVVLPRNSSVQRERRQSDLEDAGGWVCFITPFPKRGRWRSEDLGAGSWGTAWGREGAAYRVT